MFLLLLLCASVLRYGDSATSPDDTGALQAFRQEVQDPLSKLQSWNGDDPCGLKWEGIICVSDAKGLNHVTEIQLLSSNLSGTLSPRVGSMNYLRILNLMWNNLYGSIPSSLGNLQSLELLLLNGNSFEGELPPELGKVRSLQRLQVDQNRLRGAIPSSFGDLVNAKHFHMNNNSFTGAIPLGFGKLRLIHLLLDNNQLSGSLPEDIANITTLEILQLDNNPFVAQELPKSYTTSLTQLLRLSLSNCNLRGALPDVNALKRLQVLDLSHNYFHGHLPDITLDAITTVEVSFNNLTGVVSPALLKPGQLQLLSMQNNGLNGSLETLLEAVNDPSFSASSQLVLNLQYNSLELPPSARRIDVPESVNLWLHGNINICILHFTESVCEEQRVDSLPDRGPTDNSNITPCSNDICNPEIDELVPDLAVDGNCRCASPIKIYLRLKSPGFRMFSPHVREYERYMSEALNVTRLSVSSYEWNDGKLFVRLKIFPAMTSTERSFKQPGVRRLFLAFVEWTIPDAPLFGPKELIEFEPPYGIELFSDGSSTSKRGTTFHVLATLSGVAFGVIVLLAFVTVVFFQLRRRQAARTSNFKRQESMEPLHIDGVKCFSLEEMNQATNFFHESNQIGQGGYGKVYKGTLEDGTPVAIKRAEEAIRNGAKEFHTEIQLLSRVHHRNLVLLLGYSADQNEQMLVYEFMSGGTLRYRLSAVAEPPLKVESRLLIALGAAKGILYLHTEANPPIFHRDIKATNILLDENNTPKVADFGLSKLAPVVDVYGSSGHVSTVVKGTPGYLDPEYFFTHKLTDKSDVYSFGVVLLELLTGMPPIFQGKNLVREVRASYESGTILHIVDARMGSLSSELMEPFLSLALSCSNDDPDTRPSMLDVVRELEDLVQAVTKPNSLLAEGSLRTGSSRRLDNHSHSRSISFSSEKLPDVEDPQFFGTVLPR